MTNLQKFSIVSLYHMRFLQDFEQLFSLTKESGLKNGLMIEKVAVTSNYGKNGIETVYGTTVDLLDYRQTVPLDIYTKMAETAKCERVNDALTLCMGYGLRTIHGDQSASITTGSHCVINNSISFDIKAHKQLRNGKEVMMRRFAHEMLHEFGYGEAEVLENEQFYYEEIKNVVEPLISSMYALLSTVDAVLEDRINSIFTDRTEELVLLNQLYNKLVFRGLPDFSQATINVWNPITNEAESILFL